MCLNPVLLQLREKISKDERFIWREQDIGGDRNLGNPNSCPYQIVTTRSAGIRQEM